MVARFVLVLLAYRRPESAEAALKYLEDGGNPMYVGPAIREHVEKLAKARGGEIDPSPTHAELASRVATHREAVTRELNALETRGVLRRRQLHLRKWRNWQTHQLEGLAGAIPWRFESSLPHHL